MSRCALTTAWFVPTVLLTSPSLSTMMWSLCAAALPAALPKKWIKVAIWASALALPFVLPWMGYAAMNGIGPGAAGLASAKGTTLSEALGALGSFFSLPGFMSALAAHALLIVLALVMLDKDDGAMRVRKGAALGVFPLAFSAVAQGVAPDLAMTDQAALSSPLTGQVYAVGGWLRGDGELRPSLARRPVQEAEHAPVTVAVLVIGESQRLDAFGPERRARSKWDDAIQRRVNAGLGAWLPRTCAAADNTNDSVPLLVSGTRPEERDDANARPTMLMKLKAAGYRTSWYANNGINIGLVNEGVRISDGADLYWAGSSGKLREWEKDEVLVDLMKSGIEAGGSGGRAVILHIQGAHYPYVDRYPKQMEVLTRTEARGEEAEYDRANAYTAKNIEKIALLLDEMDKPAFVVFTSDHGENLASDRNGLRYHMAARISQATAWVPGLVLWNKAFSATGRQGVLKTLAGRDGLAHADLAEAFVALAGAGPAPEGRREPTTWGALSLGETKKAVSCSLLKP